jgi:hypothetical protein
MWAGIAVHVIAWEDGSFDRLPVEDRSAESLNLRLLGPLDQLKAVQVDPPSPPSPDGDKPNTESDKPNSDELPPWDSFILEGESEAAKIRQFLTAFPMDDNATVVKILKSKGLEVSSSQVTAARKALAS